MLADAGSSGIGSVVMSFVNTRVLSMLRDNSIIVTSRRSGDVSSLIVFMIIIISPLGRFLPHKGWYPDVTAADGDRMDLPPPGHRPQSPPQVLGRRQPQPPSFPCRLRVCQYGDWGRRQGLLLARASHPQAYPRRHSTNLRCCCPRSTDHFCREI